MWALNSCRPYTHVGLVRVSVWVLYSCESCTRVRDILVWEILVWVISRWVSYP